MTDNYQSALDAEKNGDYSKAARLYALRAFETLSGSEFTSAQQMRRGVTLMLESISTDVRAGNQRRAKLHYQMTRPVYDELFTQSDKAVTTGLLYEWQGDALWMLSEEGARNQYQLALDAFEDISLSDQMLWGAIPEYDNAYGALSGFLAEMNESYPETHSMDFTKRVQYKLALVEGHSTVSDEWGESS